MHKKEDIDSVSIDFQPLIKFVCPCCSLWAMMVKLTSGDRSGEMSAAHAAPRCSVFSALSALDYIVFVREHY